MHADDDPHWLPIEYVDFYDVPRLFWVGCAHGALLFDCPFSDALDEYLDRYDVYALPSDDLPQGPGPWALPERARRLGRVLVRDVQFDETRRRAIRADVVARFAKRGARTSE